MSTSVKSIRSNLGNNQQIATRDQLGVENNNNNNNSTTNQTNPPNEVIIDRRVDARGNTVECRYIKGKLLGKGGFAKCYVGTSERSRTNYAIKLVAKSSLVKTRAKLKVSINRIIFIIDYMIIEFLLIRFSFIINFLCYQYKIFYRR